MKKVLVAISGGVDSAVVAHLLKQQGYEVEGVTLLLFDNTDEQMKDAKWVCKKLAIKHHILDVRDIFKSKVINAFIDEYKKAFTPNPCALCNRSIKFGVLYDYMQERGYDYLATGHYVKLERINGDFYLKPSATYRRDQVYFLHGVKREQLNHLLFPLGEFTDKEKVKQIAIKHQLLHDDISESEGICFTKGRYYADWLKEMLSTEDYSGAFIDENGNVIGEHEGYYRFTIGQRRGLGIDVPKGYCVVDINSHTKQVLIGPEHLCYHHQVVIDEVNWLLKPSQDKIYDVKIFNWGYRLKASYKIENNRCIVTFEEPVRAIVNGQYAVFYDDDYLIGGGKIVQILKTE